MNIISQIINGITTLIRKTSLGAVVLLLTLFALFNAPAIWGEGFVQMRTQLMIYLVATSYYYATTNRKADIYKTGLFEGFIIFSIAFIVALMFFSVMPFQPSGQNVATSSFALIFTHVFVVAANEEILFRGAIPDLLPIKGYGAQMVSAVLFGLFHWTAYGAVWGSIVFAMVAGAIFGLFYELYGKNGLVVAIAAHSAWNLYALGVVGVIFGGAEGMINNILQIFQGVIG